MGIRGCGREIGGSVGLFVGFKSGVVFGGVDSGEFT